MNAPANVLVTSKTKNAVETVFEHNLNSFCLNSRPASSNKKVMNFASYTKKGFVGKDPMDIE
jgi:hypothetical protein